MNDKKVLIVDDEAIILTMLEEIFSMKGYQVIAAASAEKALEVLADNKITVMFLDIKLSGMSGIDLCRRIRKDNSIAIIYALTGYVNMQDIIECRRAGFDDYFIKPVGMKTLLDAAECAFKRIERWMDSEINLE